MNNLPLHQASEGHKRLNTRFKLPLDIGFASLFRASIHGDRAMARGAARCGYRGNELGLTRWQVELVHKASEAVRWRISDLVRDGMTFNDAKAHATRQAQGAWQGFGPGIAEGVRRVVASYGIGDLEPAAKQHCADQFRKHVENSRSKPMGCIERALFRLTGLTF